MHYTDMFPGDLLFGYMYCDRIYFFIVPFVSFASICRFSFCFLATAHILES